ncbi:Sco-Spondin [Manis pentadactyla]|nr:Sco-Spondin [Manis pentadactyla]
MYPQGPDDFQELGGRPAVLAATFGNSWRLPDSEVPPAGCHEACLYAYCAGAPQGSGPEGRLEAVCTTLANYAQDCAKQHTHPLEEAWLLRRPIPGAVLIDGHDVVLPWIGPAGLSISRASSAFLVLRWPGAQVLWGVSDPAAYSTLDPCHAHQVQGLCGTFTRNQQDDFLTPAGDMETSIAAFASKFQVAGEGRCPLEDSAPLAPCSTHTQRHVSAEAACAILYGPTFQEYQECAPACSQNWGEPEDCGDLGSCVAGCNCPPGLLWDPEGQCVPPSLCPCQLGAHRYAPGNAIMKDCNHWSARRGASGVALLATAAKQAFCPRELSYVPGACLLTWESPGANHSCPPSSMGGCVCPPGTVLLDEHCVPPELCPCHHGGQWYPPSATIQEDCNVCVCQGRQWHCTGQQCSGRCQASGAPHYVTFDRLALTFPRACEYLLVRETRGQFTVSAQNLPCGACGLTCIKALTVRPQSTAVHMLRGQAVMVNGVSVTLPKVYTGPGPSLHRAGLFLLLTTCLGLTVLWDGGQALA